MNNESKMVIIPSSIAVSKITTFNLKWIQLAISKTKSIPKRPTKISIFLNVKKEPRVPTVNRSIPLIWIAVRTFKKRLSLKIGKTHRPWSRWLTICSLILSSPYPLRNLRIWNPMHRRRVALMWSHRELKEQVRRILQILWNENRKISSSITALALTARVVVSRMAFKLQKLNPRVAIRRIPYSLVLTESSPHSPESKSRNPLWSTLLQFWIRAQTFRLSSHISLSNIKSCLQTSGYPAERRNLNLITASVS